MTKYAIYQGKKVAYSITGNGFPLVFVHGFCEDRSMWDDFIMLFSLKYTVITVDVGGFGESELPNNLSISTMAMQINTVLEIENIERCIMIGHSMGGYIALAFAELFDGKLVGLTMFHTHPFADTETKKVNRNRGLAFLKQHGVSKFVTPLLPQLFSPIAKVDYKHIIQNLIYKARTYELETVYTALAAIKNRPDRSHVLTQINCPVQFIIGKLDGAVSFDQSLQQAYLPKVADIQIFNDIGHMGMFTSKDDMQKVLKGFVAFCLLNIFSVNINSYSLSSFFRKALTSFILTPEIETMTSSVKEGIFSNS